MWCWPLLNVKKSMPIGPGEFGAIRKHDIHCGVDLYCEEGQEVVAVEDGVVVTLEKFTGYDESPWWENTEAVLIEGTSGVVLYGELIPTVVVGDKVCKGQVVGKVKRVLKKDKGLPTTMLHLELHLPGTVKSSWWIEERPASLLDPTDKLAGVDDEGIRIETLPGTQCLDEISDIEYFRDRLFTPMSFPKF